LAGLKYQNSSLSAKFITNNNSNVAHRHRSTDPDNFVPFQFLDKRNLSVRRIKNFKFYSLTNKRASVSDYFTKEKKKTMFLGYF